MKTVVLDPVPVEVARLIERRGRLGQDRFDEIWEGTHHMAPVPRGRHGYLDDQPATLLRPYAEAAGLVGTGPVNIGERDDYRVPDRAYHRRFDPEAVYYSTAAVVVEILSPDDETYNKLPFYAAHHVEEVLVVEPVRRRVRVLCLAGDGYQDSGRSSVLSAGVEELQARLHWL
ncbi:MAG: Uma2 family endonuclease [Acidimicrobiales bacterium]